MSAAVASALVWLGPLVRLPPASSSTPRHCPLEPPLPLPFTCSQEVFEESMSVPSASGRAGGTMWSRSVSTSPSRFSEWFGSRVSIRRAASKEGLPFSLLFAMLSRNQFHLFFLFSFSFFPTGTSDGIRDDCQISPNESVQKLCKLSRIHTLAKCACIKKVYLELQTIT